MKRIFTAVLLVVSYAAASGNEIYNLTLERSIDIAKQQSYRMQNLQYTYDIAAQSYKVAISGQRTSVTMDMNLPTYNKGVGDYTDDHGNVRYYSIESLRMGGSMRVNQPLPTNGRIYFDTDYSTTNDYSNDRRRGSVDFGIGLSQPIDALYGYNASRAAIKRAKLDYEQASKEYKRAELDLIYLVSQSYYRMLLQQRRMEIARLNLERQSEAAEIAANKYEAGLIREVDALQMEVDLASSESSYDAAVLNVFEQTNSFKDLLGLNSRDSINLISDLSYEIVSVDPELAVKLALENRLEMREQEINVEQQRLNLKQQKAAGLPTANLDAYYGKAGRNSFDLNRAFGPAFSNLMDDVKDRPASYRVGLRISIPIIDWGRNRARVRISEARLQQSLLRQDQTEREIESQVRSLISSINSNFRRLQILEKSVVVAEKSFDITMKRYSDGDIDSQSMAQERNRLNTAYTEHLDAFINYQLSITDLTRQTFYDFKLGKPIE